MSVPEQPLTLLDACAVVNLYATGWMEQIVDSVDGLVAVVDVVEREAQYVYRGGTGEDAREREAVDLEPLLASNVLSIISTTVEEELLTFLDLSQEVGQGEAMTAAVAIHRGAIVVTDDRRATRVVMSRGVVVRSSLDLVQAWASRRGISATTLRSALVDLQQRGNYEPRRSHPFKGWWDDVMGTS